MLEENLSSVEASIDLQWAGVYFDLWWVVGIQALAVWMEL